MKRITLTMKTGLLVGAVAFAGALGSAPQAQAADRDWAVAGKILAGVAAADILFNHLPAAVAPAPTRVVYQEYPASTVRIVEQPYVYYPPPQQTVVYQSYAPQPVVTYVEAPIYVAPSPVVVYRTYPPPVYSSVSIGFGGSFGHGNVHHPWGGGGYSHHSRAW